MRKLTILSMIFVLGIIPLFAQQSSTEYPVDLDDLQPKYAVGSEVVVKGSAPPPQSAGETLGIRVTSPAGAVTNLRAAPDAQGAFSFRLPKIAPVGRHKIVFIGPGNVNSRQFEFEVVELAGSIATAASRLESLTRNSNEVLANLQRHFAERPQDAETAEVRRRLERTAAELRRMTDKAEQTREALRQLESALAAEPRLQSAAADGLTQLGNWTGRTASPDDRLMQLAAGTRSMPTKCDSLDTAAEALSFVSTIMNFVAEPTSIVKNLLADKINPTIVNLGTGISENGKFAATEANKVSMSAMDGLEGVLKGSVGLLGDTAQLIVGKLFANYCSVLEGTVESEFEVDQKKVNLTWWQYKVTLKGKFRLWAEKDQPVSADGIVYTGKMEGNAVKVEFFEDIFLVERPNAVGKVFLRKRITPPVVGNTANDPFGFGQIIRQGTPGHFLVRYKGQLRDDKMALHQESVSNDFSQLFMNRVIIGIIPRGGLVPVVQTFNFPIQKAAWIINRTTKGDFILPVQRSNDKMILKETFTRDETLPDGVSKVNFKVVYNLSN